VVQTVTIPLSWANNIPGVSGVEDVTFDVPQVSDIEDAVDRLTPDLDDIGERVDFVTLDIPDIQDRLDDLLEDIEAAVDDVTVDLGDVTDEIRQEVEEALADLDLDVPGQVGDLLGDIDQAISGIQVDIEQLDDRIVEQLPEDISPGPLVEFESIFGALRDDIVAGLTEAIQQLLDQDGQSLPDVPDVRTAVSEEVLSLLEDLPGGDLLTDPEQFIDDQIQRVTGGLVDDGPRQELQDVLEEVE
jgi:tetrahydromethanopterin S-methyltransferase subunit G